MQEEIKIYAGVGSRATPANICSWIVSFAKNMANKGYWCSSGAAEGADTAFEKGAHPKTLIYLPWPKFLGHDSGENVMERPTALAYRIASEHHPVWQRLGPGIKALLARDVHQVLGTDCKTPVRFVVCWTADGAQTAAETSIQTGGTGMAIRIADTYKIPVWNLNKSLIKPKVLENEF